MAQTIVDDIDVDFEYDGWVLQTKEEKGRRMPHNEPYYKLVFKKADQTKIFEAVGWDKEVGSLFPEEKKTTTNMIGKTIECFEASVGEDGKLYCPECTAKEGGTMRIITHYFKCPNKGKEYCQKYSGGAKKRSMKRKHKKTMKKSKKTFRSKRK
jgi:hypothetical protein